MACRATCLGKQKSADASESGMRRVRKKCVDPDKLVGHQKMMTLRIHSGTAGESTGRLSGEIHLLRFVLIATASSFGIEDELPRAVTE